MLGEKIRELRLSRKMSQVELAKALNVTKQSVSNWENNNILPSIDMLRKIALYFSCSSDYLLEINSETTCFIETTDLTFEQAAHIKQLVDDLTYLNKLANNNKVEQLSN